MDNHEIVINADDVQRLNRTAIDQTAKLVRIGANLFLAIGVVVIAGWVWNVVRLQSQLTGSYFDLGGFDGDDGAGALDRVDVFATQLLTFGQAFLPAAVGLLMRLLADRVQMVSGGSLTGWQPGDIVPVVDVDVDLDAAEPSAE